MVNKNVVLLENLMDRMEGNPQKGYKLAGTITNDERNAFYLALSAFKRESEKNYRSEPAKGV